MFSITPIVSSNYTASWGEQVRIDMSSKTAPEIIAIQLPAAAPSNAGQVLSIVTCNQGGAENGSAVQVFPAAGQTIGGARGWAPQGGEQRILLSSDGKDVQVVSVT